MWLLHLHSIGVMDKFRLNRHRQPLLVMLMQHTLLPVQSSLTVQPSTAPSQTLPLGTQPRPAKPAQQLWVLALHVSSPQTMGFTETVPPVPATLVVPATPTPPVEGVPPTLGSPPSAIGPLPPLIAAPPKPTPVPPTARPAVELVPAVPLRVPPVVEPRPALLELPADVIGSSEPYK